MKDIGFLGGTFDPPHFGHLHLALELMERGKLDEVWLCPAQSNPLKEQAPIASANQRLMMTQLAVQQTPRLRVLDLEVKRPGPSFTIDTIQSLQETEKNCTFHLLLGDDALDSFWRWKDAETLAKLASPLTGLRSRSSRQPEGPENIVSILLTSLMLMPVIEISATEIRARLKTHQSCAHLVPGKVLDFIAKHRIY